MKVTESNSAMTDSDISDLKKKSARGGMMTMLAQAVTIAVQLISTVVLARFLSPEDYGVMAMVMAVTAFAGLFREMGLSSAAIQKKDLTRGQQSNLFWLNVAMGSLLTLMVALGSPLVAWFYKKPELTIVTLALSANFIIGSLATQHGAMLVRNMQFGRQSIATVSGAVVSLIVAVVLALQGKGYWSLVWGTLAGGMITTLSTLWLSPFRPGRPSRGQGIREMLGFGANVTAFNFVNYFARNLDNLLIGRVWGASALGNYSRAYQLLMFPITAIRGPITSVAFPAMSRLQDEPQAYRAYYRRIIMVLANLTMPISAFLFVASAPVILLVLGEKWEGVIPIFSMLAITAFIQTPYSLTGMIQLSLGRGGKYFRMGVVGAVLSSLGFCIGVLWGPKGVAMAYAITTYLGLIPILLWAFHGTTIKLRDFFGSIFSPCVASILSGVVASIVLANVLELSLFLQVVVTGFAFCLVYMLVLLMLPRGRDDLRWFFNLALASIRK